MYEKIVMLFALVYTSFITNFINIILKSMFEEILISAIFKRKLFISQYVPDDVHSNNFSVKILCHKFHKSEAFHLYVFEGDSLDYFSAKICYYKLHKHEVFHQYVSGDSFEPPLIKKSFVTNFTKIRLFTLMCANMIL